MPRVPAQPAMTTRGWALFAALGLIWGIPYLLIAIAVDELSPGFVAFARVALAFLVLLPLALHRGAFHGLAAGGRWRWLVLYALVEIAVPFPLIGWGETRITSSLAAILIATVPLMVAVIAIGFDPAERAHGTRLAGLVLGFAGVVALLGLDVAGRPGELLGAAAILVAAFGYACGPLLIKHRLADVDPVGPICGSLGIAAIALAPLAVLAPPSEAPSAGAIASVVVLGVICSALAFLLLFALIAEVGPGRATVITYVNPAVAVLLGVGLRDETIGATAIAGLVLVLAGSWLATGGRLPGARRPAGGPGRPAGDLLS